MTIKADRSRYIEFQRCPRARWYRYEIYGHGIEPNADAVALVVGKAVHAGLAKLLSDQPYEDAILAEFPAGFDPQLVALAVAMVKNWQRVRLSDFLQQYEVLEVECERSYTRNGVTLLGRSDGLLKERGAGDVAILSFKTTSRYDSRTESQGFHDDQHLSEAWLHISHDPQPSSVHMEYLLKGWEKHLPDGGMSIQSPLIRGWVNEGIPGSVGAYAARYEWQGEDGRKHRLGKGWVPYEAWQHGIDRWLDWLEANDPAAMAEQIIVPPDYTILEPEMESWWRQFEHQTRLVDYDSHNVESFRGKPDDYVEVLDSAFPQHRRSCDWPGQCAFQQICFGPVDAADPLASGDYRPRTPNHPAEVECEVGCE